MGLQPFCNTAYLPRACTSLRPNHRSNAASCHSLKSRSRCLAAHRVDGYSSRRGLRLSSSAEGRSRGASLAAKHQQSSNTDVTFIHDPCRQSGSDAYNAKDVDVPAVLAMAVCSFAAVMAPLTISFPAIASSDFSITTSPSATSSGNPIAEVSGLFGLGSSDSEEDPVDPFTLYGAVYKKYVIEVLKGEDVVSRKRGFTVTTCASTMPVSAETPAFNSLPIGERVFQGGPYLCIKRESKDLEEACSSACTTACDQQLSNYDKALTENSGFSLSEKLKGKVLKSGKRQCNYECNKQGKSSTFVVPARNF